MKILKIFVPIILLALTVYYCSTVPITGRSQLNLVPASEMNAMSFAQYSEFIKSNKLSSNKTDVDMVRRVGAKIQKAVENYFVQKNLSKELDGYQWEFNVVESEEVNAWCMPGGKVVVYTGILPIAKDELGLSVIMGHEIAHAIAQHGSERMSLGLLQQLGGVALSVALKDEPETTQNIYLGVYGLGSTLGVILPFDRSHESEADRLGLIFMAMAGYDPNAAVEFWTRMAANSGGGAPPEWLSTHPSNETRISDIKKLLPEALQYYKK